MLQRDKNRDWQCGISSGAFYAFPEGRLDWWPILNTLQKPSNASREIGETIPSVPLTTYVSAFSCGQHDRIQLAGIHWG